MIAKRARAALRAVRLAYLLACAAMRPVRRCELCRAVIPGDDAIAVCGRCIVERS